jgi:hypothetical protein
MLGEASQMQRRCQRIEVRRYPLNYNDLNLSRSRGF